MSGQRVGPQEDRLAQRSVIGIHLAKGGQGPTAELAAPRSSCPDILPLHSLPPHEPCLHELRRILNLTVLAEGILRPPYLVNPCRHRSPIRVEVRYASELVPVLSQVGWSLVAGVGLPDTPRIH